MHLAQASAAGVAWIRARRGGARALLAVAARPRAPSASNQAALLPSALIAAGASTIVFGALSAWLLPPQPPPPLSHDLQWSLKKPSRCPCCVGF